MSTPPHITRLAQASYLVGSLAGLTVPEMIAEAIAAERKRYMERVESEARRLRAAGAWGDHHRAFEAFSAALAREFAL